MSDTEVFPERLIHQVALRAGVRMQCVRDFLDLAHVGKENQQRVERAFRTLMQDGKLSPPPSEPKASEVPSSAAGADDLAYHEKLREVAPTPMQVVAEVGEEHVTAVEGSKVTVSIDRRKDPKAWAKYREMDSARRKLLAERSRKVNGAAKVNLKMPSGEERLVFEEVHEAVEQRTGARRIRRRRRTAR